MSSGDRCVLRRDFGDIAGWIERIPLFVYSVFHRRMELDISVFKPRRPIPGDV